MRHRIVVETVEGFCHRHVHGTRRKTDVKFGIQLVIYCRLKNCNGPKLARIRRRDTGNYTKGSTRYSNTLGLTTINRVHPDIQNDGLSTHQSIRKRRIVQFRIVLKKLSFTIGQTMISMFCISSCTSARTISDK